MLRLSRNFSMITLVAVTAALTAGIAAPPALAQDARPTDTDVSVAWPESPTFTLDTKTVLTGKVTDKTTAHRTVVLQQRLKSGWRNATHTRTTDAGTFALPVPTGWVYSLPVRVRVLPEKGSQSAQSQPHDFAVAPTSTPVGLASEWSPLRDKPRFRYNPCSTITYRFNPKRAPEGALDDIKAAVKMTSQGSGLRFKYLGTTKALPGTKRTWPTNTNVVIGWASPSQTSWPLTPNIGAYGGVSRSLWGRDASGKVAVIQRGGIVVNTVYPEDLNSLKRTQLLMHEMGHVVGLGHVDATTSYMNPGQAIFSMPMAWGAGDLAGLARVGMAQGCAKVTRR